MGYITGENRGQITLFPETIDDYITEDNPVRVIDAFINHLDLEKCQINRFTPAKEGRPAYDPKDLLKLYLYGYFNKVRSSRKLMKECQRNIEVMWLLRKLTPDFRTIADFRKNNIKSLKNVFKAFVKLCLEMNLYQKELIAIDGSKFKAVNAKDKNYTIGKLKDRIKWIEEDVAKYMAALDQGDKTEKDERPYSKEELQKKIKELTERKDLYEGYMQELTENNLTQKSITDPEAKLMKNNGKFDVCYNVQTAVDNGSHMLADFLVTDNVGDYGLLTTVAKGAMENLEVSTLETVADKGYRALEDVYDSLVQGIIPNTPLLDSGNAYTYELEYTETVITEELRNSCKSEDIAACFKAGVVPSLYKDTAIEIEVIETLVPSTKVKGKEERESEGGKGSFVRDPKTDTALCPMGYILKKTSESQAGISRYSNQEACKKCTNRCTRAKFKDALFASGQDEVESRFWRPFNKGDSLGADRIKKSILLKFTPDLQKVKLRKGIVEHPFGTIKRWCDGSYLLLKGKTGATADLSLSFLAYNMKRAINMIGVRKILANIQGIV